MKLVSVLMSVYNEKEKYLKASIESILNQTYQDFEFIIIIDNPSNESIKKIVETYNQQDHRIKVITNQQNIGLSQSLNKGLDYASGTYIARMDADDIALKERIEYEIKYLEQNNLDFVFSDVEIIDDEDNKLYAMSNQPMTSDTVARLLRYRNISRHPTWLFKREILETLEEYRDIKYVEDYDFSFRCLTKGYKIGKIDKNILLYRIRTKGISRSNALDQFLNARILKKAYSQGKINDYNYIIKKIEQIKVSIKAKEKYSASEGCAIIFFSNKGKNKQHLKFLWSILRSRFALLNIWDMAVYKFYEKMM